MMFNDDTPETPNPALPGMETAGAIETPREVAPGERVKGTIVKIGEATSFVDFGGRSEGAIDTAQLHGDDGQLTVKEGDSIEATVESVTDGVVLTLGKGHKGAVDDSFIDAAFADGQPVDGTVKAVNKGGLVLDVNGVRGFCPLAQIDLTFVSDASSYIGKRFTFRIIQWEKDKKNLVLSRRALLQEDRSRKGAETRAGLVVGADLEGIVKRLAAFGAFIDLGGVEGLAHISELSRHRVNNPAEVVKEGDSIKVRIIKIEDLGGPKERISLSLKALEADPWETIHDRFHEGDTVEGKVVRLADFGAFVELAAGIDGLIHLSELSWQPVAHPRDAVAPGTPVTARVLRIEPDRKRISLSLKALQEAPPRAAAPEVKIGQVLEGTVASVKNYGVFVNLPTLGPRVSGLVPRSETGESRNADLNKRFPAGTAVKAEVIQIDDQGRIKLSLAAAHESNARRDLEEYRRSQPAAQSGPTFGPMAELLRPLKEKMESAGQ